MKDYFTKLDDIVKIVSEKYFIDNSYELLGEGRGARKVDHWKVLMGVFSYVNNRNTLLVGNPGAGKTTFSGVISAIMSGLPFDLYDKQKVPGHPDQTKDTMFCRADLGRLAEEGVVWQPAVYLPALTLDELNRLPPGKQSIFLEYIRTGSMEHLGQTFNRGKTPIFATMNYNGTGTYPVPIPSLDRFDISLEFQAGQSWLQDYIRTASRGIISELGSGEMTDEIVNQLLNKKITIKDKLELLKNKAKENRKQMNKKIEQAYIKNKEEPKRIPDLESLDEVAVLNTPFTADGKTYLECIWDEINMSPTYGENRHVDPRDTAKHNLDFASAKVIGGISQRCWDSIKYFASMVARYVGDEKVDIVHINAVAPYCMSHRIDFSDDYKAKFAQQKRKRGERQEQDLSRRLLEEIKKNYDKISTDLKLFDKYLADGEPTPQPEEVKKLLAGPEPDHPRLRNYYNYLKHS